MPLHVVTDRSPCWQACILKTFNEKGLPYVSALALQNCRDLLGLLHWNHAHGVRLFRRVIGAPLSCSQRGCPSPSSLLLLEF